MAYLAIRFTSSARLLVVRSNAVKLDALERRADALQISLRLDTHHARFAAGGHDTDLQARELEGEAQGLPRLQVHVGHEEDAACADVAHQAIAAIEFDPQIAVESLVSAGA